MENKLSGHWYRDKAGNKIDAEKLEVLLRDNEYRVVQQEKLGPYFISTVWMGVPYGCKEPFDYFETMVFKTPEWAEDPRENLGQTLDCYRYHSYTESLEGHIEVVNEWKQKLCTPPQEFNNHES